MIEINALQLDNKLNSVNCMIMLKSINVKYLLIGDRMNMIHIWTRHNSKEKFQRSN
jgi:hypothetical protein